MKLRNRLNQSVFVLVFTDSRHKHTKTIRLAPKGSVDIEESLLTDSARIQIASKHIELRSAKPNPSERQLDEGA